jgi:hypothetical protein
LNEKEQPEPVKTLFSMRRLLTHAVLLVVAFLIGLVPMWLKSREGVNMSRPARLPVTFLHLWA